MTAPSYAIGIDLGTTHCALAQVDLARSEGDEVALEVAPLPQLIAPGEVQARPLLPSFLYLPHPEEISPADRGLPWGAEHPWLLGELARERGAHTPIRLVSSAKSWLCHPGVDRRAPILPPEAPPEVGGISPLEASVAYLTHLREAWDHTHPEAPLQEQLLTLTVPASFDPAARELTAEAADLAGLRVTLLEEPQAALYSWLQATGGGWRRQVRPGDLILVVDVGGGTADFSLIAVAEEEGVLQLHRLAVGDHILLGGDNMDLALAHVVASKLAAEGTTLDPWQLRALTHGCRSAKERLLGGGAEEAIPVVVPSRGAKLIGGSLRTELTRQEVAEFLIEGFFPGVEVSARPAARTRVGLTQFGLPYAQDPAVTRHLAAFLGRQERAATHLPGSAPEGAGFLRPTAVLFNGGVFKAPALVARTLEVLNGWLAAAGEPPARALQGADLDLAVSRGAAYAGYVRQGGGVRIRGGTARAYYVGVESAMPAVPGFEPPLQAVCVAPFGLEEGSAGAPSPQQFGLVVGQPVRFRFFGSTVRRQDRVGDVLEAWSPEELQELGEIEATLPPEGRHPGEAVAVRLRTTATEIGTLRLEAQPLVGEERWRVEFDVRGGEGG